MHISFYIWTINDKCKQNQRLVENASYDNDLFVRMMLITTIFELFVYLKIQIKYWLVGNDLS